MPHSFHFHPVYIFFVCLIFLIPPAFVFLFVLANPENWPVFMIILLGVLAGMMVFFHHVVYRIVLAKGELELHSFHRIRKVKYSNIVSMEHYMPPLSRTMTKSNFLIILKSNEHVDIPLWKMFSKRKELESLLENKVAIHIKG